MSRFSHFSLCVWWLGSVFLIAAPPVIPEAVKESVRNRVDFGYVPGIVVGMVNEDGRSYFSYGNLTHGESEPVDENSLYEIASVTKTFTAMLLAEMVEAGEVALTDQVGSFLPAGVSMPSGGGANITLKHLATHTSGLPSTPPNLFATIEDFSNQFAGYDLSDFYEFLNSYTLPRFPGVSYEYSNAGMALLGHVLALSQGKSYEALLQERVLEPMSMMDTGLTLSGEQMTRRAPGHHGVVERPKFEMNSMNPAGGLQSSAADLCSYLEFQLGIQSGGITPALELSQETQFTIPGSSFDSGLGWWLWGNRQVIQHGGDSHGSTSFVGFKPSTQTGVVVLSNNRGHNSLTVSDLGFHCLNQSEALSEIIALPSVSEAALRLRVGRYVAANGLVFQVGLKDGWLSLDIVGQTAYTLFHISNSTGFKLLDIGLDADLDFGAEGLSYSQNGGAAVAFDRVRRAGSLVLIRGNGKMLLTLDGEGDVAYPIEWSSDLNQWQSLGDRTVWDDPHEENMGGAKYFRIGED